MEAVRGGTYVPDATRSGLMVSSSTFESASATATSLVEGQGPRVSNWRRGAEQKDRASTTGDAVANKPVEDSADSTESSSSSSDSSTDDEPIKNFCVEAESKFVWKVGCRNFQHKRTRAIHAKPSGSDAFLRGRKISAEHDELKGNLYSKEWLCQQCDRGKPIRTLEGMADAFDRAVKRIKPT